jgi:hypothetical protein
MVVSALLIEQYARATTRLHSRAARSGLCFDGFGTATDQRCYGWNEWLAWLCIQQCTCSDALLYYAHAADTVITVQAETKMHNWNEWLAWLLIQHAQCAARHCCYHCNALPQIFLHDNRAATSKMRLE